MLAQLISPVTGLLDKFIEDKDQKNALAHEISTMAERHAQELAMSQIKVNQEEAKSGSLIYWWVATFCRMDLWNCFTVSLYLTALYNILCYNVWSYSYHLYLHLIWVVL